jgi:hypothetical protein
VQLEALHLAEPLLGRFRGDADSEASLMALSDLTHQVG